MFRTELTPPPSSFKINHHHKIITLGSCFAEVIGDYFLSNKFLSITNPFGIIYNPLSIFHLIDHRFLNDQNNFINTNEVWLNFQLHSSFYGNDLEDFKKNIHQKTDQLITDIKEAEYLIITFGTAWIFKLVETNTIVANCHKVPSRNFTKELLSIDQIITDFSAFYKRLEEMNGNLKIILTVSPVRHLKDTLPLNSVSKSVLRLAAHYLEETFSKVVYFPSYELLMDDLRDYRFYKDDMLHPTPLAERYIWDKFVSTFMEEETKHLLNKIEEIQKDIAHRPFYPSSSSYKRFLESILKKLYDLNLSIDFKKEIDIINDRLQNTSM